MGLQLCVCVFGGLALCKETANADMHVQETPHMWEESQHRVVQLVSIQSPFPPSPLLPCLPPSHPSLPPSLPPPPLPSLLPSQLIIGNYGLSLDQQKAQMALWAIFASVSIIM